MYLRENAVELQFQSTEPRRASGRLLKLVDVGAEMKKRDGRDAGSVRATTDMLAAGREELRNVPRPGRQGGPLMALAALLALGGVDCSVYLGTCRYA